MIYEGFDVATLSDLINKAKSMEKVRDKMKLQDEQQKNVLGKRSYSSYEPKKYEVGSSLGSYKKLTFEKASGQVQVQSQG